jgi:hypothetical protein
MKYTVWKGRSQLNNPIFMPQPHGAYDGMKETVSQILHRQTSLDFRPYENRENRQIPVQRPDLR